MNRRTGFGDYSHLDARRFRQPKLEIAARALVREVGEYELRAANIVACSLKGHTGLPIERKQRLRAKRKRNRREDRALGSKTSFRGRRGQALKHNVLPLLRMSYHLSGRP